MGLYFEVIEIRAHEDDVLSRAVPTLRSRVWKAVVKDIAEYDQQNVASPLEALQEPLQQAISKNIVQAQNGYIEVADKLPGAEGSRQPRRDCDWWCRSHRTHVCPVNPPG